MLKKREVVDALYSAGAFTIEDVNTKFDEIIGKCDLSVNELSELKQHMFMIHADVLEMKNEIDKWSIVYQTAIEHLSDTTNDKDKNYDDAEDFNDKNQHHNKSIILYGVDTIMKKMNLDFRPRLLITDASADLANLKSRLIKHVQWLDGPQRWRKSCTLCESVNMVMGTSCNASIFLCVNSKGHPELMATRRVCNAKGKHIGGRGFYDLVCRGMDQ